MARMNPTETMPTGDPMTLDSPRSDAPFRQARAARGAPTHQTQLKPLRPSKEPPPVADEVDPAQVLNPTTPDAPPPAAPPPGSAAPAPPAAPPQLHRFPGGVDNRTAIPPDTAGAVGTTHVFHPLNNNVWIFDRTGQLAAPIIALNKFWEELGIEGDTFDPRCAYDPIAKRYIFVTMAGARQPTSSLLIAVSKTDDPTGDWASHAIRVDDAVQTQVWFDFPSVGFTADKITISINLYTRAASAFAGATVYAIDKASLYEEPHQALVQRFMLLNQGATHVPATTYDAGVTDQFLLARWSGNIPNLNQGFLACYRLSGNVATGSAALTRVGFLTIPQTWATFPPGDIAPQQGTDERLSVGDDRIQSVCLRNGHLFACHTVMLPTAGPTRSAVQWYEIDTAAWTVLRVERIDDPTGATMYSAPSLAVNRDGQVMIGHAQFAATMHGSGAFTLHSSAATAPTVFAPGLNSYRRPTIFGGNSNRWGDYSHTQVDPNDTDFWTVQQFADNPADTWATMWTKVAPPGAAIV